MYSIFTAASTAVAALKVHRLLYAPLSRRRLEALILGGQPDGEDAQTDPR